MDLLARARLSREADLLSYLTRSELRGIPEFVAWDRQTATLTYAPSTDAPLLRGQGPGLPLTRGIEIAKGIANWLVELHARGVLFLGLSPAALAWNPRTRQLEPRSLGSARRVGEVRHVKLEDWELGAFPYLAPEQTGHFNREVDERSDLYGLGVTLFELLSGRLPIEARDRADWVDAHLNRAPRRLADEGLDIPDALDAFVAKLMAKDPDDRPASARECADRLAMYQTQFETGRSLVDEPLPPRATDEGDGAGALAGRSEETAALLGHLQSFAEDGGPALAMVSGPSGVDRATLVSQLQDQTLDPPLLFAHGKFGQIHSNVPFAAMLQGFDNLFERILRSSGDFERRQWRERLAGPLGNDVAVLATLCPALTEMFPEQPAADLGPSETPQRLREALRRLVSIISGARHLVVFIDALQWTDDDTMELLGSLLAEEHRVFYVLGHESGLDAEHPVSQFRERLGKAEQRCLELELSPS